MSRSRSTISMTQARRRQLDAGRRFWIGAGRLVLVTAVATATAWAGTRVNRPDDMSMIDPDVPDVLKRYIGDVRLETGSLREALDALSKVSGVKIEIDPTVNNPGFSAYVDRPGPPPAPITLKRATLGIALAAVLSQFSSSDPATHLLTYHAEGVRIRVDALLNSEEDGRIARAYGVHDLLEQIKRDPAAGPSPDLELLFEELIAWHVPQTLWPPRDGVRSRLVGEYLVLSATPQDHRNVQRLLLMLRHAQLHPKPAVTTRPSR